MKKTCNHIDSVRVAYETHCRSVSRPLFVCRTCGADAPDPRCASWEAPVSLPWPLGSAFVLLEYRKPEHAHPALRVDR